MVITLVTDTFDMDNNGITVSAKRFAKELQERGHEIRVLTCGDPKNSGSDPESGFTMYFVPEIKVPLATRLAHKQNTLFGKPVRKMVTEAICGADVVHIYQPWLLDGMARRVAKKLGVPAIAAFHIQPENITYNLGLGWFPPAAHLTYYLLYFFFYRHFRHIHCPSKFIAAKLRSHGYRARLHVISNGVHPDFFCEVPKVDGEDDIFRILMVGRLSPEKRQDVLIQAIPYSKYKNRIKLYFAGHGPKEAKYRKLGSKLPLLPTFDYYTKPELIRLIHKCDLYVHASDIEIEGISCIEAFCCGLVPVISNSKKSATVQFALCEESLFKSGDPKALAARIDEWIEDPRRRQEMGKAYARYGRTLSLEKSVRQMEKVYKSIKRKTANGYYHGHLFNILTRVFHTVFVIPVLFLFMRLFHGIRIKGIGNFRGVKGGLTVCNHVHMLDSVLVGIASYPRKLIFPTITENLNSLFPGVLVNLLGGVPIPESSCELDLFFDEMELQLFNGRLIHFFPEGDLRPYDREIRRFKKGAFYLAARGRVPVIPMKVSFLKPKGLRRLFRRKPVMELKVGKPIYPLSMESKEDEKLRMEMTYRKVQEL